MRASGADHPDGLACSTLGDAKRRPDAAGVLASRHDSEPDAGARFTIVNTRESEPRSRFGLVGLAIV